MRTLLRRFCQSAVLLLVTGGAGGLTSAGPPSPPPSPPSPPSPPPSPPSPPPSPPSPPDSGVVFFILEGDPEAVPRSLVPMACYHPTQKRIAVGQTFLGLVPDGATVALSGGRQVKVRGRAKLQCDTVPRMSGLKFSGSVGGARYGVWPPAQL